MPKLKTGFYTYSFIHNPSTEHNEALYFEVVLAPFTCIYFSHCNHNYVHVSFHLLVAGVQLDSHALLPLDGYMCAHVHVSYVINTLIDLINYDTSITRHQTIIE